MYAKMQGIYHIGNAQHMLAILITLSSNENDWFMIELLSAVIIKYSV